MQESRIVPELSEKTTTRASRESPHLRLDQHLEMPSVPIVLTKILQLMDEDKASARRLEDLILHDPSLSVRILKLSNSAFYSFRSEVRTIAHAIALLGLNLVRSLAIGVSIFESFTKGMREEAGQIHQLWMHSVGVGLVSQEMWNRRSTRSQSEFALLCGLLHDLGKVVYFKQDAGGYARLFAMKKSADGPDLCTCEIRDYGVDHPTVGSLLARQWHLPHELATVVQFHHKSGGGGFPLVAAVSIADILVRQAGIGNDGDCDTNTDLSNLQGLLKMGPEEFDSLSVFAGSRRAGMEEFFELM